LTGLQQLLDLHRLLCARRFFSWLGKKEPCEPEGRERIYFDRIWNDFTADPGKPDEDTRNFFAATYAQPGGMRAAVHRLLSGCEG
jgi:hypothetical protein